MVDAYQGFAIRGHILDPIGGRSAYFFDDFTVLVMTITEVLVAGLDSMTDSNRSVIDLVEANMARHRSAVSGSDIVAALGSSPLAEVRIDRFTIKWKVPDIRL
jgi:hypothetical protein